MGNNPSAFSRQGANQGSVSGISAEKLKLFPVEMVSWDDAQAFIKKLIEKERRRGHLYPVPTEEEGEYACREGATSEKECSFDFYFEKPSSTFSTDQANFNGNYPFDLAPKGRHLGRPTRVGSYPPNRLGLCDMNGNVSQWTSSSEVGGLFQVYRGGSWEGGAPLCVAGSSRWRNAADQEYDLGFRLARVPVR